MLFKALQGISRHVRDRAAALPSQCAVCRAWPSERICSACTDRFAQSVARCQRCALRVPDGVTVCGACLRNPPLFDACLAAVDYGYPWAAVIADFKFRGDVGWTNSLSALMRATPALAPALAAADKVLPVPLSDARLRQRGFNQSALLARQLARSKADATALVRVHDTEVQSGLPRAQRLRNLRGAFVVEPARAAALRGQRVVLVDDVMTTGATLHAATEALHEAGVGQVTAIVLARTGSE